MSKEVTQRIFILFDRYVWYLYHLFPIKVIQVIIDNAIHRLFRNRFLHIRRRLFLQVKSGIDINCIAVQ